MVDARSFLSCSVDADTRLPSHRRGCRRIGVARLEPLLTTEMRSSISRTDRSRRRPRLTKSSRLASSRKTGCRRRRRRGIVVRRRSHHTSGVAASISVGPRFERDEDVRSRAFAANRSTRSPSLWRWTPTSARRSTTPVSALSGSRGGRSDLPSFDVVSAGSMPA